VGVVDGEKGGDEDILMGLLARGQIVQAVAPIALVKNGLAQVGGGEASGKGGEEEGIFWGGLGLYDR